MTQHGRILLLTALLLSAILACDGAPNKPKVTDNSQYVFNGVAIADYDRNWAVLAASLLRDSSNIPWATIRVNGDTLQYANPSLGSGLFYGDVDTFATSLSGENQRFIVQDSQRIVDSFFVSIPDTFSILTIEPPNRIVTGLQPVSVSWSGSDNADGYILATVRRQLVRTGTGYSQYVTSLNPAGTIPPDAFSLSPGPNPDTGWYYVYVYAYIEAPDSAFTRTILPVPLPSNLPDNIAEDRWTGQVGGMTIARRDSVHVVTQP